MFSTSPQSGPLSTSPSRLESYAEIVRGMGGPQDIALDTVDVSAIMGVILAGRGNSCTVVMDMHLPLPVVWFTVVTFI